MAAKINKASNKATKAQQTVKASKVAQTQVVKNPEDVYRTNSSYHLVVKSLRTLGIGKFHEAEKLVASYAKLCPADKMRQFKSKEARNKETHKSWQDRIIVNATVVERKDYGSPLRKEARHEVLHERKDKTEAYPSCCCSLDGDA